jgi:hypothetical protein
MQYSHRGYQTDKHETLLQEVGLETLKSRRQHHRLVYLHKIKNKLTPIDTLL